MQIVEWLDKSVPRLMRSHGFEISTHPDCARLITAVNHHLRALLGANQAFIDALLAKENNKKARWRYMYEDWIFQASYRFILFFSDELGRPELKDLGAKIPCDLVAINPNAFRKAAEATKGFFSRQNRKSPGGGRRRASHISLKLNTNL